MALTLPLLAIVGLVVLHYFQEGHLVRAVNALLFEILLQSILHVHVLQVLFPEIIESFVGKVRVVS